MELLFVGRLVPYKGADMVIEAIGRIKDTLKRKVHLTIVGDGPEKENLKNLAKTFSIYDMIDFAGWVDQSETLKYYQSSDIFCFPSVREFGGAVVLEAMACGTPCIVIDHGGIGEYVTEESGFKIQPLSREHIINETANKICLLAEDDNLRFKLSQNAFKRGQEFEWSRKARTLLDIYQKAVEQKSTN